MDLSIKIPAGGKLHLPYYPVDMVALDQRAASFTKRSIKKSSKLDVLYLALEMIDLTTLEGMDTPGKVKQMCLKAKNPVPLHLQETISKFNNYRPIPSVAAVCVYPTMVAVAKEALAGSPIHIASVATGFPSGLAPLDVKIADVKYAIKNGADEIDMVIDRGAFHCGEYQKVFDEIVRIKDICGVDAHLKVILETGELKTYDKVRLASTLAMEAGADFIKTSTGKISPAATLGVTLVMLNAIMDFYDQTGKIIGMKPAGGIRTSKDAIAYLCMLNETLGENWLTPDLFRFGASALLNDLLKQIYKEYTGSYYYEDIFSFD
jgi:deoxyribose-phosphate aldolase